VLSSANACFDVVCERKTLCCLKEKRNTPPPPQKSNSKKFPNIIFSPCFVCFVFPPFPASFSPLLPLPCSAFFLPISTYFKLAMIYIGELWRYLYNQPPQSPPPPARARGRERERPRERERDSSEFEFEQNNPLRVIAGNGLRTEIWTAVKRRFGISRVVEHFGLTEMPAGPYMNFFGRPGACGFIPPGNRTGLGAKGRPGKGGQKAHGENTLFSCPSRCSFFFGGFFCI